MQQLHFTLLLSLDMVQYCYTDQRLCTVSSSRWAAWPLTLFPTLILAFAISLPGSYAHWLVRLPARSPPR